MQERTYTGPIGKIDLVQRVRIVDNRVPVCIVSVSNCFRNDGG